MLTRAIGLIGVASVATALQGCAGMADAMSQMAGIGVVKEETSTFDGATMISMSPAFLYAGRGISGNSVKLAALWNSKAPDQVALIPTYSSDLGRAGNLYVTVSRIDINIDGEISSYESSGPTQHSSSGYNTVTRTIYTESKGSVVVPWSVLNKMMTATDCRLRIYTSSGYEDSIFSVERIPGGQAAAKFSLTEFVSRVETARGGR